MFKSSDEEGVEHEGVVNKQYLQEKREETLRKRPKRLRRAENHDGSEREAGLSPGGTIQ